MFVESVDGSITICIGVQILFCPLFTAHESSRKCLSVKGKNTEVYDPDAFRVRFHCTDLQSVSPGTASGRNTFWEFPKFLPDPSHAAVEDPV